MNLIRVLTYQFFFIPISCSAINGRHSLIQDNRSKSSINKQSLAVKGSS